VLLIGNNREKVKRAVAWVARLDRENSEGMNYYTYFVQNGKCTDLAKVLIATFQEQSTGLDTSQVSPDHHPFHTPTQPTSQTGASQGTQASQYNVPGQPSPQQSGTGQTGKTDLGTSTTFGEASAQSQTSETPTLGKGVRITASASNNTLVIRATARD